MHQLQLVLLSSSCFTAFSVLWQGPCIFLSFRFHLFSFWQGVGDPFVSQNSREFYSSHSLEMVLVCAYTILLIWSNFHLLPSSQWITFSPRSHFVHLWYICLSCDKPFRLHIIIILLLESFYISVSWWSFTGILVTASLLKSPGHFWVFWPISIML